MERRRAFESGTGFPRFQAERKEKRPELPPTSGRKKKVKRLKEEDAKAQGAKSIFRIIKQKRTSKQKKSTRRPVTIESKMVGRLSGGGTAQRGKKS